ncbi:AraC family transcriptional regulator [Ktedonobacter racemifer]|uniref:Transcriptional regulator, AraC family n=1 Tax=Ktedonobacter racemifer DSM 44963 TaxID=485913 RepID=D6TVD7_KTERA|nr:AraC family transcriptional regulator [Ktedonobacter racemifer]EFH84237.1 transcriptional regulator, AraC family [Ktedonobacter racemifer DSM 44963]
MEKRRQGAGLGLEEKTTFWRDPAFNDLELLQATYVTHSFAPHTHEGYAIGVIESGAERFKYRGSSHIAPQGWVVAVNPGEVHTGEAAIERGWSYRMFYPDVSLVQRAASPDEAPTLDVPFFPSPVIHDPMLAGMLAQLHLALASSPSTLERESRLTWTFAHLVMRHADTRLIERPTRGGRSIVQHVRTYLEEHATENVSLDQLASLVQLSPFHLLRVFRETVGLPPHSYLTQLRVMRAKRLIASSMPLAEVAGAVGFSDQSHLTRHFKALVGVTPGQYARACQR